MFSALATWCSSKFNLFPEQVTQIYSPIPVEKELGEMRVGEVGFTLPWAMSVLKNGKCYLNNVYPVRGKSKGTSQLFVYRDSDGYHVDLSDIDYVWNRTEFVYGNWGAIPVVSIRSKQTMKKLKITEGLTAIR